MKKNQQQTQPMPKKPKDFLRKEYNFLDSSKMFLNILIFPLIVSFIFVFIVEFIAIFSGHSVTDATGTWIYIFFSLTLTQATFLAIYFIYNKKNKIDIWKATKISKKVNPWIILIVIGMGLSSVFLISPFINLMNHLYSLIGYSPDGSLPFEITNFWKFLYAAITMALIPAVIEELLMRGVVFQGTLKKWKPIVAIVMGAVMFMLMHGALQQTIYQFIMGIALCYIMYIGKNVIYPMIFHFVNNFVIILMSYISTATGATSEPLTYSAPLDYILPIIYLILAAGILVGFAFLLKRIADKQKQPKVEEEPEISPEVIKLLEEGADKQKIESLVQQKERRASSEKLFFWLAIGLGCLLWIVNTVYEFLA